VEVLLATLSNFVMLYLIALLTGRVWETTMFIAGFVPLRSLAGGYHAKTHFRCLMTLLFTYAAFLAIIYLLSQEHYVLVSIISVSLSVFLVFLLSPMEDKNKPLSASEKKYYRGRSQVTILIYAGIILLGSIIFQQRIEFLCVAVGILSVSLSLVASYLGKKRVVN